MAGISDITKLYVGYFNRAPDPAGLQYWLDQADMGMTLDEIAESFSVQTEATSLYPFLQFPDVSSPTAFINSVYLNLFNRPVDDEGLEYWTGQLEGGTPIGQMIVDIMSGAQGDDATILDNKVEAGLYWAGEVANVPGFTYVDDEGAPIDEIEAAAQAALDGVDETTQSVTDSQAATDAFIVALQSGEVTAGAIQLSVTADDLDATSGNDVFVARVVQNDNGEQTNQLGTGDILLGGGGNDVLSAKIQQASALNASPTMAITPETNDVEIADFTALTIDNSGGFYYYGGFFGGEDYGFAAEVGVNAKYMEGLDRVGSIDSDADLIIYNLTTLTDSGEYSSRRNTDEMTVRMDHTAGLTVAGEDDGQFNFGQPFDVDGFVEDPADLTVLFDQDYVLSGQTTQGQAFYFLLDEDAEIAIREGADIGRLNRINVDGLRFDIVVDGETRSIDLDDPENAPFAGTHQGFVDALQDELQALIDDGTLPEGTTLTLDPSRTDVTFLDDGTQSDPIPAIVITSGGGEEITATGFSQFADAIGEYDVYGRLGDVNEATDDPIAVDVELLKVGRAQDGGELTIGSMDVGGFYSSDGPGIEVFNITVFGDDTQDSSVASMQSTNDTLETVTMVNAAGSEADVQIGNVFSRYQYDAGLYNVREFLAGSFDNDISLTAHIDGGVVSKFMDLGDTQNDADDDDAVFTYDLGQGDDYLELWMDASANRGFGSNTREDFELNVDTGAGDDVVVMANEQSQSVTGSLQDWYKKHIVDKDDERSGKLADRDNNVDVVTGGGDDVVTAAGATAFEIRTGAGEDCIFTDNSGSRANWVFNMFGNDANTPDTQREIFANNIANLELTVTFQGISSTVDVGNTRGSADGETLTDLDINQAIKRAINDDDVLSKLLSASDASGRTLVVDSLIDGLHSADDLTVDLDRISPLTQSQIDNGAVTIGEGIDADFLGFNSDGSPDVGSDRWEPQNSSTGFDSSQLNNNTIEGGGADDILVLSSSSSTNFGEDLGSTETVEINGAFGRDTLLNFKAATTSDGGTYTDTGTFISGYDIFDASAILGGVAEGVNNDTGSDADDVIGTVDALAARWVHITGRLDDDPDETEAEELEDYYNSIDTDASEDADNLVITVDNNNVGRFYDIANGDGQEDVTVTFLGAVELGTYTSAAKSAIGNWDGMNLDNFVPLTQSELFDVI